MARRTFRQRVDIDRGRIFTSGGRTPAEPVEIGADGGEIVPGIFTSDTVEGGAHDGPFVDLSDDDVTRYSITHNTILIIRRVQYVVQGVQPSGWGMSRAFLWFPR